MDYGEVEQGLDLLDQALKADPRSGTAYAYQALAYAMPGRLEAEASLQRAQDNGYADWQASQEEIESWQAWWQEP